MIYSIIVFSLIIFFTLYMCGISINNIKIYRKLRRGKWARVNALIYGKLWIKLHPECVERYDENWN